MATCIFCNEYLKKGHKNHFLNAHKLTTEEYNFLFSYFDPSSIRKVPIGAVRPIVNPKSTEFI